MINRCVRLNIRSVIFMLFSIFLNGVKYSNTSSANNMDNLHQSTKTDGQKNISNPPAGVPLTINKNDDSIHTMCPVNEECGQLEFPCIKCNYSPACTYGKHINITCEPLIACIGDQKIIKSMKCRYCFLTEFWEHSCVQKGNCNSNEYYRTNCTVYPNISCLGNRVFFKNTRCNWTNGAKWSTALLLSITLGGFGADRFYLGHWQEGIGKLFSFGGLGVWTLIDALLISLHYLGPADHSFYI